MVNGNMGIIQQRYEKLAIERSPFLEDAYRASELTIQFLLPRNSYHKGKVVQRLKKQHQSVGAMGVNNISNKLLLTLFPPNQPFFKMGIDDFTAQELTDDDTLRSNVEQGFSAVERATTDFVERSGIRPPFEEALKHLIVPGNILINRTKSGGLEIFHMDQYVLSRDPDGKVREIVIDEHHTFESLPEEVQAMLKLNGKAPNVEEDDDILSMYTRIKKIDSKTWQVTQEIQGLTVPVDGPNTFKDEDNPWFALRFHAIKGSAWGRGYIHNFLGDLDALEQESKSIQHGAKMMAFMLFLIKPNSTLTPKDIIKAPNGGFKSGNVDDVGVLQADKNRDFTFVSNHIETLVRRLAKGFLMDESITRNAERVTAEEIRILAQKLEESLGGFYSILTQDFQVPYLRLTLKHLRKIGKIPELPEDVVKPIIITGLDALGRNSEADRLRTFGQELASVLGPEVAGNILKPLDMARRLAAARGIDSKGLIKEQSELDQQTQNANSQALAEKLGGPAIKGGVDLVKNATANSPETAPQQ